MGQDPVIAVASPLMAKDGRGVHSDMDTFVAHSLRGEGFDASEDGTGRGTPIVPISFGGQMSTPMWDFDLSQTLQAKNPQAIAFSCKDDGGDATNDLSPTVRAGGFTGSHANAGVMPAVAFDMRGREGGAQFEGPHDTANIRAASGGSSRSYVAQTWAVRRLTPKECERLQGFPDGYTDVPWRNKNWTPDGPRYKALGNSMAVNAMRWIGRRIAKTAELSLAIPLMTTSPLLMEQERLPPNLIPLETRHEFRF